MRQFTSNNKNFRAEEIPDHLIGCTGIFHLFNVNTNQAIGKIYGDDAAFMPAYTGSCITWQELSEISSLCFSIQNEISE